jgi:hypothetical protein
MADKEELDPKARAADILLGGLGYGEDAQIISVKKLKIGYKGLGCWLDGEEFEFESEDPTSELEDWALNVLASQEK